MALEQKLILTQKLALTQAMQQSLQCLQMSAQDLDTFLQEAALSNPLLEVEDAPLGSPYSQPEPPVQVKVTEQSTWDGISKQSAFSGFADPAALLIRPASFGEYLNEQLGQMRLLDNSTLLLCRFLVGCLNSSGYLDCSLSQLAEETGWSLFDLEQALFVVQSLDPVGVGARSLSECLLLQLAQSQEFNELNIHLVQAGLPLLAAGDYAGLTKLLGAKPGEVRHAAEIIRSLNPIPSRGFYSESVTAYVIPEALIRRENKQLVVEMNDHALPRISLNQEYCAMVGQVDYADAQPYLREKLSAAKDLIASVHGRNDTLARLVSALAQLQQAYFLHGEPLLPMTMKQLADHLELSTSTVSRAVKDKYIQFEGKVIPLRSLFTVSLQAADGEAISAATAKQQLRRFVAAEEPCKALSDESLCKAMSSVGIELSRRTVAKYRAELGIPSAAARKRAAASR